MYTNVTSGLKKLSLPLFLASYILCAFVITIVPSSSFDTHPPSYILFNTILTFSVGEHAEDHGSICHYTRGVDPEDLEKDHEVV
ncbi:hypothetical protein BDR07DRAFT_1490081 [Suillus spraguei]|nr:hypothetical protein BDR07DRAFT_1490081 [Suillus spraguei]